MKLLWSKSTLWGIIALMLFSPLKSILVVGFQTDRSSQGLAHAATSSPGTTSLEHIIQGAKREGQAIVRVPSTLATKEGFESAITQGVNKTWGLNLKIRIVPSGGMDADVATVISEINSGREPSWDSVVGTASTLHRLKQRGGIEAADWAGIFPKITPRMTEKGLDAIILSVNWYVPYYNTRSVSKEDLANLPKKWEDFLDPRWKGKLIHPLGSHQQVLLARVGSAEVRSPYAPIVLRATLCLGLTFDRDARMYMVANVQIPGKIYVNRVDIYRTEPVGREGVPSKPKLWTRFDHPYGVGGFNHGACRIAQGPDGLFRRRRQQRPDQHQPCLRLRTGNAPRHRSHHRAEDHRLPRSKRTFRQH